MGKMSGWPHGAAVDAGLQFARSDEAGRVDEHGRMVALEAAGQIAGGHVQGRVVQAVIAENGEHGVVEPGLRRAILKNSPSEWSEKRSELYSSAPVKP